MPHSRRPRKFTSALRFPVLTPAYDLAIRLFTREKSWRSRLIDLLQVGPEDRILDIGCGTGTLAIALKKMEPGCHVIGVDPDSRVLKIAKKKCIAAGVEVEWKEGFVDEFNPQELGQFSKVVASLVLHQTSLESKKSILQSAYDLLSADGIFCIADYGVQRTLAMKLLFRWIVQTVDGKADTQPNADGFLLEGLIESGFSAKEVTAIPTLTGSISLYSACKTDADLNRSS